MAPVLSAKALKKSESERKRLTELASTWGFDIVEVNGDGNCLFIRVVTWYMGSGLKAQNMTGIRAQRKGLRAQKNGIRDHKAYEPESGIRFITQSKNFLSQYFSA